MDGKRIAAADSQQTEFLRPSWPARITGAIVRRARRAWRGRGALDAATSAERALCALESLLAAGTATLSPGTAAEAAAVLSRLGREPAAALCLDELLARQANDGSFSDGYHPGGSLAATAEVVAHLSAWHGESTALLSHVRRDQARLGLHDAADGTARRLARAAAVVAAGSDWLSDRLERDGRLKPCAWPPTAVESWDPLAVWGRTAAALDAAAVALARPALACMARRAAARVARQLDHLAATATLGTRLAVLSALSDDAFAELRQRHAARLAAWQAGCGGVALRYDCGWTSAEALARLAVLWFGHGQDEAARRALRSLERHQATDGSLPSTWMLAAPRTGWRSRADSAPPAPPSPAALVAFLSARVVEVATAFARPRGPLPATIAADDGRLAAVARWAAALAPSATLVDLGCGPGRYLRALGPEAPRRRIGIDLAQPQAIGPGIEFRWGSMLRLPLASGSVDAALAVESLEHTLVPAQAIAEMCRVVRPGGRLLLIDKSRRRQALSLHEPWERWFTEDEVATWLAAWCDEVDVRPLGHGQAPRQRGLFLCWTARRRAAAGARAA